jgi:hypothetical protein
MSDQQNTVESVDARKAFMAGIISPANAQETTPAEPATEAPEAKAAEKVEEKGEGKTKKTPQERIVELAHQRKEAVQREQDAKRENEELRSRLKALEASVKPIEVPTEPKRYDFASEEAYINALTDFKVDKRIAEREESQRQAKQAAEMQEIDTAYLRTVKAATARYPDFRELVSEARDVIPPFMVMAIKESEVGGDLTYYLAKFPDETKKLLGMRPVQALKYLTQLERELIEPEEEISAEKVKPSTKKAPEPITPVRGTNLADMSSPAKNFEEYKARRIQTKRR